MPAVLGLGVIPQDGYSYQHDQDAALNLEAMGSQLSIMSKETRKENSVRVCFYLSPTAVEAVYEYGL